MTEFSIRRNWGPKPRYENVLNYRHKDNEKVFIAGPCSMESEDQINLVADNVVKAGATHLRAGLFRAGTYPGANFGPIEIHYWMDFANAAKRNNLKTVIEVLKYDQKYLDFVCSYADVLQIGCRAMQHYQLLREVGSTKKPVFLKRSTGSTIDEWLGAAEHLLVSGCEEIYLIERGSSTFHNDVRWTPIIHSIPSVKSICDIPIIIDGSHSCGRRDLVPSIVLAGMAAGADGLLCEVHPDPQKSISDAEQALTIEVFSWLMSKVKKVITAIED